MKDTVLQLLQIFEDKTDNEHYLTKEQIIQEMRNLDFETFDAKQFYRKIEELRNNGYNIETKRTRTTYYYLSKNRLTKTEWIYLLNLLLGNKDLSVRETNRIIEALENMSVCYESIDYAEKYKTKISTDKCKFNQLENFRVILKAIEQKSSIEYTLLSYENGQPVFSERKTCRPIDFFAEDNRIVIIDKEKHKHILGEIIDVEII